MARFHHILLAALALGLAGCSTVGSRTREKAAVFASLDPAAQASIRQGTIKLGFTPDMVYIALGRPDAVRERVTGGSRDMIWTYNAYDVQYEGTVHAGLRRVVVRDSRFNGYRVYHDPAYADVYSERSTARSVVIFRDGRVTAIEQLRR